MNTFILLLAIFFANLIQAITGFAGTVLAMPGAMLLVGMDDAKMILSSIAFLSCLLLAAKNKEYIRWEEVGKITGLMSIGMVLGIFLYGIFPSDVLLPIYGVLVICLGVKNLVVKKEPTLPKPWLIVILIVAGVLQGLFVSGGSLAVIYATCVLKDKQEFRATLTPVWVILNALLIGSYYMQGKINTVNLSIVAMAIIPMLLGTWVGYGIQKKIDQKTFLTITYILLIISGASIL